eukprot:TRINITY_DN3510_c0_g2_i1.p1 TRINITY_DN3510_c0_g2~~TRINITY_DN3510_c0_g2_i1.p1  ORF type:complete len:969 (-),score=255.17 TRINITY_DN3510_c0_g2_i1:24-2930(-)
MATVIERVVPTSSENDDRKYRAVTLSNKLTAMLISDPTTDKSAAGMDVRVGQLQDPLSLPGLAHFCEHMLFLGTEKYPDENSYSAFLSSHTGNSNAYTSTESTNYFFDVGQEFLPEALDRFSQFFTSPLFTDSATEREINAVDAENAKNYQSDMWRKYQLTRSISNPLHPFNKFGTGNKSSLWDDPKSKNISTRDHLLSFHKSYYSANVMKLAVIGRESLDDLEKIVVEKFGSIKNFDRPILISDLGDRTDQKPFTPAELGMIYYIVPVKDFHEVTIQFPLPSLTHHYKTKPSHYLSHLIGHEGPGSLLSYLKLQNWALSLAAGSSRSAFDLELFTVTIKVTQEGLQNHEQVIGALMEYIEMLKEKGVQEWIWKEQQLLDALSFRFKQKEEPIGYVSAVSTLLQNYPPEKALTGEAISEEFKPELIETVLGLLNPRNMFVMVTSQTFSDRKDLLEEKWYNTKYAKHRLEEEKIRAWEKPTRVLHQLRLPAVNEFIATDFNIKNVPKPVPVPELITNDSFAEVWFKQDYTFLLPHAIVVIASPSPLTNSSPKNAVMTSLLRTLIEDYLNEETYSATLAELNFIIEVTQRGFKFTFKGYNEKIPLFVTRMFQQITSFKVKEDKFRVFFEKMERDLRNTQKSQPYEIARSETSVMTISPYWSVDDKLAVINTVSVGDLQSFSDTLWKRVKTEWLVVGNITLEETNTMVSSIRSVFGGDKVVTLLESETPDTRMARFENKTMYVHRKKGLNPDDKNSCLFYTFQIGQQSIPLNARAELLDQLTREPAYDQLRTQEQLGYLVWSSTQKTLGVTTFKIIVQSASKDAKYLNERAREFLKSYRTRLEGMSEEEFEKNKSSLIAMLEEKDKKLGKEAKRYWEEIANKYYWFDREEMMVKCLKEEVNKGEMLKFWDRFLAENGEEYASLSVEMYGKEFDVPKEEEGGSGTRVVMIGDRMSKEKFKRSLSYWPINVNK